MWKRAGLVRSNAVLSLNAAFCYAVSHQLSRDASRQPGSMFFVIIGARMGYVIEQIGKMSTAERLQVMDALMEMLQKTYQDDMPDWHRKVLAERANAADNEFEDWAEVKRELQSRQNAH